jgi:hypothetical protein
MLLAFQTVGLVLFFVSMAFRMKGNYLWHGIIMIVLIAIGWFTVVMSVPDFMNSSYMQTIMNPSSTMVVSTLHMLFGVVALVFATWLVALWRPRSIDFAAKSKRIWQSTVISWVLAYVVGLLLFVALTTTFL